MAFFDKYTIVFLRDGGGTRQFRCSRFTLFLLAAICLAVLVGGAVGLLHSKKVERHRINLEQENKALIVLMRQEQATLERLAKRIARSIPPPSGKETPPPPDYEAGVDRKVVSIRNTACTRLDKRRVRFVVDMYNVSPPKPCSGRMMFSLRVADGRVLPLLHDDTTFQIIRFRKFDLVASLPMEPVEMAGASVVLEVLVGGDVVFRKPYPLK